MKKLNKKRRSYVETSEFHVNGSKFLITASTTGVQVFRSHRPITTGSTLFPLPLPQPIAKPVRRNNIKDPRRRAIAAAFDLDLG